MSCGYFFYGICVEVLFERFLLKGVVLDGLSALKCFCFGNFLSFFWRLAVCAIPSRVSGP